MEIAASGLNWAPASAGLPRAELAYEVDLVEEPGARPSPLLEAIPRRTVLRRPMRRRALTDAEKKTSEASVAPGFEVEWVEGARRFAMARLNFANAGLRLSLPEAYPVHREVIAWRRRFSEDGIPGRSLGVDPITRRLMEWGMRSWRRVSRINRAGGTLLPRLEMELLPGVFCAAHFFLLARRRPESLDDFVAAGRAVQRFWLTATSLDLFVQPEMTPLIFRRYATDGVAFSREALGRDERAAHRRGAGPDRASRSTAPFSSVGSAPAALRLRGRCASLSIGCGRGRSLDISAASCVSCSRRRQTDDAPNPRGGNGVGADHGGDSVGLLRPRPLRPAGSRCLRARNVLVVTVDTLRADRVGAYGSRAGATPHIDALARRGIVFERAFTTAPLTLPAHASLFSGLLPMHSGVRVNGTDRVPPEIPLLAEQLRASGFATGAAVGSFVLRSETGISRGFAAYDESFAANAGRNDRWEGERPGSEVVDRALAWLDRAGSERFFLWVHLFDPHAPYAPPAPHAERFAGRPYEGEVAYADACLGRLLEGMRERGRLEKTFIVVAGDHGESLGEHGEATHGVFLYDATLRVPLIVVPPDARQTQAARRVAAPVSLVDVAPTIREATGLPPSPSDGVSLLQSRPSPDRLVLAESNYPAVLLGWSPLRAARSADAKYVEAPRPEFYDLRADPAETRNLFRREDEAVRRLARELERRRSSAPVRAAAPGAGADPEVARRLASLGYLTARHPGADLESDRCRPGWIRKTGSGGGMRSSAASWPSRRDDRKRRRESSNRSCGTTHTRRRTPCSCGSWRRRNAAAAAPLPPSRPTSGS